MAKKIVSLLCALAMLVTMVSLVATFTASATEVTEKVFASGYSMSHNGDDAYTGSTVKNVYDATDYGFDYVVMWSKYAAALTAHDTKTYNLGSSWSASFFVFFRQELSNSCHTEVKIGDLTVLVTRDGSYVATNNNTANVAVIAKYNNTEICNSGLVGAGGLTAGDRQALVDLKDAKGFEVTAKSSASEPPVRRGVLVNVEYDNGALSVELKHKVYPNENYNSTLATMNGTIEGADFSNAHVSVEIGQIADSNNVGNKEMFVSRFSLTYESAPSIRRLGTLNITDSTAILAGFAKDDVDAAIGSGDIDDYHIAYTFGSDSGDLPLQVDTFGGVSFYYAALEQVTPDRFAEEATFTLTDGTTTLDSFTYSVKRYCFSQIDKTDEEMASDYGYSSAKATSLRDLCKSVLLYGAATAYYVDGGDWTVRANEIVGGEDNRAEWYKAAVSANVIPAGYDLVTVDNDGFAFTAANLVLRDKVCLAIKMSTSYVGADDILYCTGGDEEYILLPGAKREVEDPSNGPQYLYVIPVGIENALTTYDVVMKNGNSNVSQKYQLSIATVCKYYIDSNNATNRYIGMSILYYNHTLDAFIDA